MHTTRPWWRWVMLFGTSFRLMAGLSQEALALEAEIDRSYLGGIERGEHNVALMNLIKLTDALGINVVKLIQHAKL